MRFCVVLSVRVITVRYHMAAVGVRAAGRITGLLGDGGSEFKGDTGCDHPFSPLLPALTLLSSVFSARTLFWASVLLHCVPVLCSMECFGKSSSC